MMKKQVVLSVAITMHDEGVLVHKTMRSVFRALERLKEEKITYEIILHLDNGDEKTRKYLQRYSKEKDIFIYENKFGDLGSSRNFIVEKARGEYVAFLDGDDLISDNWYLEGIKILKNSKEEIVVHPEAILTFGVEQPNVLTLQKDSYNKDKDTMILLGENRWTSVAMAKRETFKKNKYKKLRRGYSYEDYIFNIETIFLGIKHRIAKNTILFYRRSNNSMLTNSNNDFATIPYVKLFDFNNVKNISEKVELTKKKTLKDQGYKIYKKIRDNDFLNYFITPVAKMTIKVLNYEGAQTKKNKVPQFVIDEWKKINCIDSQLYPYKNLVSNISFYSAENQSAIGEAFCEIAKLITKKPDYIFIVPWIVRGGADKVMLNYIEAIKQLWPEKHILVISTLPSKNIWADRLPEDVDFVDFGKYDMRLPLAVSEKLFTRIIIQTQCKNLHIINSEYGYNWARRCGSLLKNGGFNLNVSIFCPEFIKDSNMKAVYSYDNPCLFEIYDNVNKVFTDNQAEIDYIMNNNGYNENKFTVHYQSIRDAEFKEVKQRLSHNEGLNVLWASRVVPVKLPELVVEIGKKLDDKVTIHVYGEISGGVDKNVFDNVPTIKYHGAFDGFGSLPIDDMDIFLYTSLSDGIPNVILEAAAAGLPMIATNDGGVGEVVRNGETGILINDFEADDFVKAIKWAKKHMPEMWKYAKNAQKLLRERHSTEHFLEDVKRDFDL